MPSSHQMSSTTLELELASYTTVAGEDCRAVTELVGIDGVETFLVALYAHHGKYWSENFFVVALHAWLHVVDKAWVQEETGIFCLVGSVNHNLCAFSICIRYKACNFVAMLAADERSHFSCWISSWSNFDVWNA